MQVLVYVAIQICFYNGQVFLCQYFLAIGTMDDMATRLGRLGCLGVGTAEQSVSMDPFPIKINTQDIKSTTIYQKTK